MGKPLVIYLIEVSGFHNRAGNWLLDRIECDYAEAFARARSFLVDPQIERLNDEGEPTGDLYPAENRWIASRLLNRKAAILVEGASADTDGTVRIRVEALRGSLLDADTLDALRALDEL
jgi:hypothetical protein